MSDKPEPSTDLTTPEGLDAFLSFAQGAMRENVERDGELSPVAFVIARRDPRTGDALEHAVPAIVTLAPLMAQTQNKDDVAESLSRFAKACDAHAIIIGLEAWQKTLMGQRIGEVISCSVEVRGQPEGRVYFSYIQREGDKATTSDWQSWPTALRGSRFMGLLLDDNRKESCDA